MRAASLSPHRQCLGLARRLPAAGRRHLRRAVRHGGVGPGPAVGPPAEQRGVQGAAGAGARGEQARSQRSFWRLQGAPLQRPGRPAARRSTAPRRFAAAQPRPWHRRQRRLASMFPVVVACGAGFTQRQVGFTRRVGAATSCGAVLHMVTITVFGRASSTLRAAAVDGPCCRSPLHRVSYPACLPHAHANLPGAGGAQRLLCLQLHILPKPPGETEVRLAPSVPHNGVSRRSPGEWPSALRSSIRVPWRSAPSAVERL